MLRISPHTLLVATLFAFGPGCRPEQATEEPENEDFEDTAAGTGTRTLTEEEQLDQAYGKREPLPPRPAAQEQCEGEGAEKRCRLVDPDPPLAAAHGVRELMRNYRWGMDPSAVLERVTAETKAEYDASASKDALAQDANRRALEAALAELAKQHVKFESPGADMWRTTALHQLYQENSGEEMVWFGSADTRRYYLFADGKLWAILETLSNRRWPGKTYDEVLEIELKKRFGSGAEEKELRDDRTSMQLVRYFEWPSRDGDTVRAYDLFAAHGVVLVSVMPSSAGERLQRHPMNRADAALTGGEDIDQVLKESGVCYDDNGDMVHDPERCKDGKLVPTEADAKKKKKKKK